MAKRRFPVFLPIGAEELPGEMNWTPFNVWWIIVVFATYFTLLFVPFDIAFANERAGEPTHAAVMVTIFSRRIKGTPDELDVLCRSLVP